MTELFGKYEKTNRVLRPAIYTEKIDGTNGSIVILVGATQDDIKHMVPDKETWDAMIGSPWLSLSPSLPPADADPNTEITMESAGIVAIWALSKNRVLTHDKNGDNFGFRAWVEENRYMLHHILGPGRHAGEWYGEGIQKNRYQIEGKRFALFNTHRWHETLRSGLPQGVGYPPGLEVVPLLDIHMFSTETLRRHLQHISRRSTINPAVGGEGVCVYHTHLGVTLKATVDGDMPKTDMPPPGAGIVSSRPFAS